jgi:hypothetical protein
MPIVEMAKDCVNRAYESSLTEGINYERHLFYASFATVLCPFPVQSRTPLTPHTTQHDTTHDRRRTRKRA